MRDDGNGHNDASRLVDDDGTEVDPDNTNYERAPHRTPDMGDAPSAADPFLTPVPSCAPDGPPRTYMTLFIEKIPEIPQKSRQYSGINRFPSTVAYMRPTTHVLPRDSKIQAPTWSEPPQSSYQSKAEDITILLL